MNNTEKNRKTRKNKKNVSFKLPISSVYTDREYNSNDGMLTSVWGPSMWHYLHTMSFNYPTHPSAKDKMYYRKFVRNLVHVLPCGKCRKNLVHNFKKLPLTISDMKSRDSFSRYIYNLHEVVNNMLGKESRLTFEEVRERYEHFRARCAKPTKSMRPTTIKRRPKENGCNEPLYGEKSKCILHIVPHTKKGDTIQIDKKCIKTREPFSI
jgi:hypothetical protein